MFDALGRLLGGSGRRPDLRVRWFGKLPNHADYLAALNPPSWAHEFANWLIGGFSRYQAVAGAGAAPMPDAAGVLRLPESQMTVPFVLRDFGGDARGRRFPFALFFGVPTDQHPGPLPASLETLARPVCDLVRLLPRVQTALGGATADPNYNAGEVTLSEAVDPTTLRKAWADQPWTPWYQNITGSADATRAAEWNAAVRTWGEKIAAHDTPNFQFNLGFPLVAGSDWVTQSAAWLSWLSRRARLDRRPLTLLVRLSRAGAGLSVLARTAVPDDFLLLTDSASQLSYVDSLPAAPESASGAVAGAPGEVPGTLADFVASGAELVTRSWMTRGPERRDS